MKPSESVSARVVLSLLLLTGLMTGAQGAAITVTQVSQYVDTRSVNDLRQGTGTFEVVAANAAPNGGAGTTGAATRGGVTKTMNWLNFTTNPNRSSDSQAYSSANVGAWALNFANGADTASGACTPVPNSLCTPGIAGAVVMPFASNVAIAGSTFTPTFSWNVPQLPQGATLDGIRVNIYDAGQLRTIGSPVDAVYSANFSPQTRSFIVPTTLAGGLTLQADRKYGLEIGLIDTRDGLLPGSANLLSRSRLYVDFTPVIGGTTALVFLPTVIPGVNGASPTFTFNVTGVNALNTTYIDPLIAVGYDYAAGNGDPLFRSVLLPGNIGDGLYTVLLPNGTSHIVAGGVAFDFTDFNTLGVSSFRVLGIETSANLSPNNTTVFITGLIFMSDGSFSGTMTPPAVNVPEPESQFLAGVALLLMFAANRRRSRTAQAR